MRKHFFTHNDCTGRAAIYIVVTQIQAPLSLSLSQSLSRSRSLIHEQRAVTKSPLRSEVVDRVSIVEAILLIINPRELLLQQGRNLVAVRVRPVVVKCPHRSRQRLQAGE